MKGNFVVVVHGSSQERALLPRALYSKTIARSGTIPAKHARAITRLYQFIPRDRVSANQNTEKARGVL